MKELKIYNRNVLKYTSFKKYRFKEDLQFIIIYDDKEIAINHNETLKNDKLKIKFDLILKTRSLKKVNDFINSLGYKDNEKKLKETLKKLLNIE